MKKHTLLLFILFASFSLISQEKKETKWDLAIRGKIAGFFIIENHFFSTGTIGVEFIHNKRHSFGIDYSFFNWRFETDGWHEGTDSCSEAYGIYNRYTRRSYLIVDYKYVFSNLEKHYVYYLNSYGKYGVFNEWYSPFYDKECIKKDPSFLNSTIKGNFGEIGLGLGYKNYHESGFGVDISANVARRYSVNDYINTINPLVTVTKNGVKEFKTVFIMRLSLFYQFGYKKYSQKK